MMQGGVDDVQIVGTVDGHDPDGAVQLSCRSFPSYGAALFNRHSVLTRWFPTNAFSRQYLHTGWDHGSIRDVDPAVMAYVLQLVVGSVVLATRVTERESDPSAVIAELRHMIDACLAPRPVGA